MEREKVFPCRNVNGSKRCLSNVSSFVGDHCPLNCSTETFSAAETFLCESEHGPLGLLVDWISMRGPVTFLAIEGLIAVCIVYLAINRTDGWQMIAKLAPC